MGHEADIELRPGCTIVVNVDGVTLRFRVGARRRGRSRLKILDAGTAKVQTFPPGRGDENRLTIPPESE